MLEVQGRKSGEWRRTPVNLLRSDGAEYLVSPRGQTQWVKNLRVSGNGRLRVGRRTESFTAAEVADDETAPILRAYLKKWKFEVGVFFDGVGPDSSDDELRRDRARPSRVPHRTQIVSAPEPGLKRHKPLELPRR